MNILNDISVVLSLSEKIIVSEGNVLFPSSFSLFIVIRAINETLKWGRGRVECTVGHKDKKNVWCVCVCLSWRAAREVGVGGQSAFF